MVVWVEGSDKRKPTNGPVLKSFYDNETDQWVGPDDSRIQNIDNLENSYPLVPKPANIWLEVLTITKSHHIQCIPFHLRKYLTKHSADPNDG